MGSLTFQFAGICTHFRFGVAAGVPHRVVLPDASMFLPRFLRVAETISDITAPTVLYYITPHFAQLDLTSDPAPVSGKPKNDLSPVLTVSNLVEHGDILSGIRVQVANATDTRMSYDGVVSGLTPWLPDYNFSSDVVLAGHAACYVDIYGGAQRTVPSTTGGPDIVLITVQTDGPPTLLVSSLRSSPLTGTPGTSALIRLTEKDEDLTLIVKNLEADPEEEPAEEEHGAYDYLLHYLTARGGIPQMIHRDSDGKLPPGMPTQPVTVTREAIGKSLILMGTVLDPTAATGETQKRALITPDDTTPACSDSQYP
jgi:hypothetical protein